MTRLTREVATMTALLDSLPAPVWARDADGQLIFANAAYARAVEAADAGRRGGARTRNCSIAPARDEVDAGARRRRAPIAGRLPAIAAGERRIFDVVDAPSGGGSAGMAIDRTEAEAMRAELARMIEAHRRVLDQLATGVAIFNADRKLTFYNTAFRSLFDLDAGLLDQTPTDAAVLEHAARRAQAAGAAGFPAVEAAALRGLSRGRAEGAHVASAGRPHAARRHHAQSGRRRHLSL